MDGKTLAVIIGMTMVTYFPRMLPLVIVSKLKLPPLAVRWLKFVPVAVLSSLLAPEILLEKGVAALSLTNLNLLAAIPCFIVAVKTKNLFAAVFTGILTMFLLVRYLP